MVRRHDRQRELDGHAAGAPYSGMTARQRNLSSCGLHIADGQCIVHLMQKPTTPFRNRPTAKKYMYTLLARTRECLHVKIIT
jgi:hypothetical protein